MNEVRLLGNLSRDPETRVTQTGKEVATFTVVATSTYAGSNGQAVEQKAFVNCVAWGRLAESIAGAQQGDKVFCAGRINIRSYEAKDGNKRWVTEVIADFVAVMPKAKKDGQSFQDMGQQVNEQEIPF